ncbi:PREDICTED: GDSL esterase/lipase At4g26790-like [Nicotiana attenuata]|uniref:Gdsl esteraselipase n=1 Tax=Nicotiana attenuata TaxID=49451 RepID=A0A1J6I4Y1_NICAT|nr:PREDICTED: GDSL esterase/lipase At4g26790-like [Nicotiana attenuata]OIT00085.1 gdsl esteraselipase [Nicotiana attenuata]
MAHNRISWLLIITQIFLLFLAKTNAKIPAIIVFGDSSVDSGNNNYIQTIARSDFMPYGRDFAGGRPTGRFSNGRITTDFISEAAGLKATVPAYLDPAYNISDFAVGVSFASAGTGYDNATADVLGVIPLWKELEYYKEYQKKLRTYLGDEKANKVISEALYALSLGTNDFLENYYTMPQRRSQYTVDQYQTFLIGIAKNFVTNLYNLGARKISLGGLPPMGCMPLERTSNMANGNECLESYNIVAMNFNDKLSGLVIELNKELSGIQVVLSNPYNIMLQMIKKPSIYGFEVASLACCATGLFEMGYACDRYNLFTCKDANKYIFWDAFHPTEKTDRIIADHVVKTALSKFLE